MPSEHEMKIIQAILKKMKQMGYPDDSIRYAQDQLIKNPEGDFGKKLVADMISLNIAALIFNEVEKQTKENAIS